MQIFLVMCVCVGGGGGGPDSVKPPIRGRGWGPDTVKPPVRRYTCIHKKVFNQPFATCFFPLLEGVLIYFVDTGIRISL